MAESLDRIAGGVNSQHVYELGANESPLGPSPTVIAAIRNAAPSLHLYPPRTDAHLCAALAEHHGRGLTNRHFFTSCSSSEGLELIARTFLRPNDEIVICSPTFRTYGVFAKLQNARVVDVPLDRTTFAHNLPALVAAVTSRTQCVVICNPNNPSGAVMRAPDMAALLASLPERVLTVVDEAYAHYVSCPDFPDSIGDVLAGGNIVVMRTFSKAYGLAGLRLGYGIARPELTERISAYRRPFHLSRLHLDAGVAALRDQRHVGRVVQLAQESKQYLYAELERLAVRFWPSEANFVMFEPRLPAGQVNAALREQGIVVHGTDGNGLPGCLRVTTGLPEANQAFIRALSQVLQQA